MIISWSSSFKVYGGTFYGGLRFKFNLGTRQTFGCKTISFLSRVRGDFNFSRSGEMISIFNIGGLFFNETEFNVSWLSESSMMLLKSYLVLTCM